MALSSPSQHELTSTVKTWNKHFMQNIIAPFYCYVCGQFISRWQFINYYYLSYLNTETTCDPDDDNSDQDEWLWNTPLAALPIMKTDNAVMSLKKFTAEALKPFGCDMDVHVYRNTDLLKQMLRKYKNPGFDITRPLCV